MRRFKFYKKWCGGIWHRNRYIRDAGRVVFFCWERKKKDFGWGGYTVETEDYTK